LDCLCFFVGYLLFCGFVFFGDISFLAGKDLGSFYGHNISKTKSCFISFGGRRFFQCRRYFAGKEGVSCRGKLYIADFLINFRFHPKLKCLGEENFVIG
jgi:hypothetical protein